MAFANEFIQWLQSQLEYGLHLQKRHRQFRHRVHLLLKGVGSCECWQVVHTCRCLCLLAVLVWCIQSCLLTCAVNTKQCTERIQIVLPHVLQTGASKHAQLPSDQHIYKCFPACYSYILCAEKTSRLTCACTRQDATCIMTRHTLSQIASKG